MGGEGHMLDMIKKVELNRRQKEYARSRSFKQYQRPSLTQDYLNNIEHFKIEEPTELSPKLKRRYQIIIMLGVIFVVGVVIFLLVKIISAL